MQTGNGVKAKAAKAKATKPKATKATKPTKPKPKPTPTPKTKPKMKATAEATADARRQLDALTAESNAHYLEIETRVAALSAHPQGDARVAAANSLRKEHIAWYGDYKKRSAKLWAEISALEEDCASALEEACA